jgi:sterile alpha motif and leucine zipper-containing kinase AZK
MKTAFMEEGAGGSFSFLELPESVPDFASGGGADAMASAVASSFGAPSSHQRPSAPRAQDAVASPFDDANSDDELAAATEERSALAEKAETPTIDLPPLIDFDAEEDSWEPPRAAAAPPPPPRPPLFGGYAQTPAQGSGASGAAPVGAHRPGFPSASGGGGAGAGGGYGSPSMAASRASAQKPSANQHSRSPSFARETSAGQLDIDASLAAFELTAARPSTGEERRVDGAAPLMFADLAPAGVSSVRVAPAPRSMLAQRGGGGIAGAGPGANGSFPSFATSQRVAYGAAPPPPQRAGLARQLSGGAPAAPQYAPGHFNQTQGAFVPAQFGTPNAEQQQQQQQRRRAWMPADQTQRRQSPSPPPPGSPPPQDWAKFDDDSAVAPRRAAAPFAPAPPAAPMNAIVPMPVAQRDAAGGPRRFPRLFRRRLARRAAPVGAVV